MVDFKRSEENPVLFPSGDNDWESEAAFNGCPVRSGGKVHLLYRAVSPPRTVSDRQLHVSSIGHAISDDGINFKYRRQFIKPEEEWEQYGCEDPRVTKLDGKFYIFYTAISSYPFSPSNIKVGLAVTRDFNEIEAKHPVTTFNSKAMALFPGKINGKIAAVLTANTDSPPARISLALFDREEQIWSPEYWEGWYAFLDDYIIPLQRTPNDHIEVGAPPVRTRAGWLLIYSYIQNYFKPPMTFGIEAALLDLNDPRKIISRLDYPLLYPRAAYETNGKVPNIVFPSGTLVKGNTLRIYYGAADTSCAVASGSLGALIDEMLSSKVGKIKLERFPGNPVLIPVSENKWEAKAVLNPAAVYEGGKVHLVYRAMAHDDLSVMGYASSEDGLHFTERLSEPVYVPRKDFENRGCEDPRLTRLDTTLYMCYTAYDGRIPRVAMTTIAVDDFLNKNWNWSEPKLISPPGVDDKDAAFFPRKFEGRYAILHRIGKSIWLDLVNDLEFGEGKWLKGDVIMSSRKEYPHAEKIGISCPPVETEHGWLLLYHVVSRREGKVYYSASAALLDSEQPWRVLARRKTPLLEPEMQYEKEGQVPNVVFPCGAVVIEDILYVYYGGGDSVIGVASMKLSDLLDGLLLEGGIKVTKTDEITPQYAVRERVKPEPVLLDGFIPGVPLTPPAGLVLPGRQTAVASEIYERLREKYAREFNDFVSNRLNVSAGAGFIEITGNIKSLMDAAEKELNSGMLPGDVHSVGSTIQVAANIFEVMSRGKTFALTAETASRLNQLFPPNNLLIRYNKHNAAELEKEMDPNDILALSSVSEEKEHMDRIWDWLWDNARPEHFGPVLLKPLVVSCEDFPALITMREASALSKLGGRIVLSNLRSGTGGLFPKLRYFTTVSKNVIEAERYGDIWSEYACKPKGFGKRIINSLEGHWGKEVLSSHNIFEAGHQMTFVRRLTELAGELKVRNQSNSARTMKDIADCYHLAHTFPDGRFVPCSAWTWASFSFKGGKGIPTPFSLHVERDWASREFITEIYKTAGGSEEEMDARIAVSMGKGEESENVIKLLFPGAF